MTAFPTFPAMSPGNTSQDRVNGLYDDTQAAANKYGAGAFADHWNDLTKGLDQNDNSAVEGFAKQYGVQRGQVGMNGQYHTMTNPELLEATKAKYQPQFERGLQNDPQYNAIAAGTSPVAAPIVGRRLGMQPYQVSQDAGVAQGTQNLAQAIPGVVGAMQATAQGNQDKGEAALKLVPYQGAALTGEAALSNANAAHVTAMQPYDTAREQAETAAIPEVAGASADELKGLRTENQQLRSSLQRYQGGAAKTANPFNAPELPDDAPAGGGQPQAAKTLTTDLARQFVQRAGGDRDKARQLAKAAGYTF